MMTRGLATGHDDDGAGHQVEDAAAICHERSAEVDERRPERG